jgi:N-acetylmuramoyl-L-alanine amidase
MIRIAFIFSVFILTNTTLAQNTVRFGKTTGSLPYLEYGLGTDRLGGAKMTFLDTGILIKVVDSTIINYKVQLAANHYAYLSKSNCRLDAAANTKQNFLTGSLLINGDEKSDYVSISLDEKLPYRSIQQINPAKIIIDVFGATSNTNWITHRTTAKEIKNVYYEQIEDDVFRVIIALGLQHLL